MLGFGDMMILRFNIHAVRVNDVLSLWRVKRWNEALNTRESAPQCDWIIVLCRDELDIRK